QAVHKPGGFPSSTFCPLPFPLARQRITTDSPDSITFRTGSENTAYISQIGINIRYNQRRNAVCLTRLHSSSYNSGYDNWYYETRFTIYDQYGNSGLFSAVRNESDWGNTIWVAEGNHTSKG
ncbi:hypothetical protein WI697_20405, partial [Tistrella mobilis]|uniref:hypothetical protein n=1 Tax=Tistrella mobilis TaxID=171437 RepID=UPI0031F7132E